MSSKLYFFTILVVVSITGSAQGIKRKMHSTNIDTVIAYLALGDSYTKGEGEVKENSFPYLLVKKLTESGYNISEPTRIAQTGWTTNDLKQAMQRSELKDRYSLVTLLIGVNNQYQGKSEVEYRKEFEELLQDAIRYANENASRVVVLSIPDYGVTPFGKAHGSTISAQLKRFNAINREVSLANRVVYCDITPSSMEAEGDSSLLVSDQLHPSKKMYEQWVSLLYPEVVRILGKP